MTAPGAERKLIFDIECFGYARPIAVIEKEPCGWVIALKRYVDRLR